MRSSAAARRYARALFELAREASQVDAVRQELDAMAELLASHPEVHDALFRPLHPAEQRRAAFAALGARLGASSMLQHFYFFLVDQRRLLDFDAIHTEFQRLADEATGRTRAEVVSAAPLAQEQQRRLRDGLARRTGREIELALEVDPSLIGGVVAKVGDVVFDGSLRTQLSQLRSNLMKG